LAQELGVSRTPVREALRRLEAEGLIEPLPRQGLVVRDPPEEDLADLCVVREALEGLAARLAARSATQAELYRLEELYAETERAVRAQDVERLARLNDEFHRVVWQASRNRYLARQLHQLREFIFRVQGRTTLDYPGRAEEMLREHRELLDAIRAGDGQAAEQLARQHMARAHAIRSQLRLEAHLPAPATPDGRSSAPTPERSP
ncbi:MAG TPA: GntR family transcriptional regulator, partial [Limnochordales bacterium]